MTTYTIEFDEIDHLFEIIKKIHPHQLCVYQWHEDDEDDNLINFVTKKNRLVAQYFRNEDHVIFYDANQEAIEDEDDEDEEEEEEEDEDDDSDYMDEEDEDDDSDEEEEEEEEETCEVCHQSAHLGSICPNGQIDIFEDVRPEETLDHMNYDLNKIKGLLEQSTFVRIHEGMGCHTIVRLADDSASLEGLFVHVDDYYYNPQKMVLVNQFVQGYDEVYPKQQMVHEWNPDF